MSRERKHRYASLAAWLPTWTTVLIAVGIAMPITFFATVPDRVWLFVIHFFAVGFLFFGRAKIVPRLRQSGMQRCAKVLGFDYTWTDEVFWLPPDYAHTPDESTCFNVLRGRRDGYCLTIFDSCLKRTTWQRNSDGGRASTSYRCEFSVVMVKGISGLPNCLIAPVGRKHAWSVPIPTTKYRLYLSETAGDAQRESRFETEAVRLISDDVLKLLRNNPGWVIEINGDRLTVFDCRRFTNRCRVPGNVPAFLEDIMALELLFEKAAAGDATRLWEQQHGPLLEASEHEASTAEFGGTPDGSGKTASISTADVYRGERLRLLKVPGSESSALTAFGCLWTALCVVIFPFFFTVIDEPPTVLYVFAVIFPTIGLLLLSPGVIGLLSRPHYDVSVPEVRVRGGAMEPGERIRVGVRQKNGSPDSLQDVQVRIDLCQRLRNSPQAVGPDMHQPVLQFGELFASDWKHGWSESRTEDIGVVLSGDNLWVEHEFTIPHDSCRKRSEQEWWGVDVVTQSDGRELFAGTFWVEPPRSTANALVLPAVIIGGFWGFGILGVLASVIMDSVGGSPVLFGFVAIAALAGAVGGAVLGTLIASQATKLSLVKPLARLCSRTHGVFQFFGSFVFAISSFFFAFYLADDVFNLFGWQNPAPAESQPAERLQDPNGFTNSGQPAESHDLSGPPGKDRTLPPMPDPEVSPVAFLDAVQRGDVSAMERLARRNRYAIHGVLTPAGGTALHQACVHNQTEAARWLIGQGANLNARNANLATPLHICAWHGHLEAAQVLIDSGADIAAEDRTGTTPRQRAQMRGHQRLADFLNRQ